MCTSPLVTLEVHQPATSQPPTSPLPTLEDLGNTDHLAPPARLEPVTSCVCCRGTRATHPSPLFSSPSSHQPASVSQVEKEEEAREENVAN